jgi:hypothetical protein
MLVFFFCSHQVTWFGYINLVLVDKLAFDQDHDNGIWYLTPILVPDCDFCSTFTNESNSCLMFNLPDLKCLMPFIYTSEL